MIDIATEELLSLAQAARRLPGRPHISTLHRWANPGVKGVRLETVRLGGRRFTSVEALQRFTERLNAGSEGSAEPTRCRPSRRKRDEQVERELERLGI
jgi:hypothetical protein